jgi:hypothetical protein
MAKGTKGSKPKQSSATSKAGEFSTETLLIAVALLVLPLAVNYELLAEKDIRWVSYDDDTVGSARCNPLI